MAAKEFNVLVLAWGWTMICIICCWLACMDLTKLMRMPWTSVAVELLAPEDEAELEMRESCDVLIPPRQL
jgi:hypothetical protein